MSKLGGSLEPLMEVDLMIADGRTNGLVTGSVIRERFSKIRQDVHAVVMAQWLMELVERLTKPAMPAPGLYDLVRSQLSAIAQDITLPAGQQWLRLLRRGFAVLEHEGFAPNPTICAQCHRPLSTTDWGYDPAHGFIHPSEGPAHTIKLSPELHDWLVANSPLQHERPVFHEFHHLMELLIHQTIDRPLNSEQVLRRVAGRQKLPPAG